MIEKNEVLKLARLLDLRSETVRTIKVDLSLSGTMCNFLMVLMRID